MKLLLLTLFVVVVSAGAWLNLNDSGDKQDDGGNTSLPTDEHVGNSAGIEQAGSSNIPAPMPPGSSHDVILPSENGAAETTGTAEERASDDISSTPFAVVGDEPRVTVPAVQDEQIETAPITNINAEEQQQERQSKRKSQRQSEQPADIHLDVPDSYPVTEAEKYFIPKEEREPGRLGGPPPLNFPGGPSDPDKVTDQVLQPPVAPAQ